MQYTAPMPIAEAPGASPARLCRLLVEQLRHIGEDDVLAPAVLGKLIEAKREQLRRATA